MKKLWDENGSPLIMLELMKTYTAHGITGHDFYSGIYRGLQWFQLKPPLKVTDDRAKAMISVLSRASIFVKLKLPLKISRSFTDESVRKLQAIQSDI